MVGFSIDDLSAVMNPFSKAVGAPSQQGTRNRMVRSRLSRLAGVGRSLNYACKCAEAELSDPNLVFCAWRSGNVSDRLPIFLTDLSNCGGQVVVSF